MTCEYSQNKEAIRQNHAEWPHLPHNHITSIMNTKNLFLLLCFAYSFQACEKNDKVYFTSLVDLEPLTFLPDSFLCTATKEIPGLGQIPWTANCEVYIADSTLQFRFRTVQDTVTKGIRENLSCNYVPMNKGYFSVGIFDYYAQPPIFNTFASYARTLDDGDVLDALWFVDESKTNYIEITHLDLVQKRVEGKFALHYLIKQQGSHGILYSEQINFKNGHFTARIDE